MLLIGAKVGLTKNTVHTDLARVMEVSALGDELSFDVDELHKLVCQL